MDDGSCARRLPVYTHWVVRVQGTALEMLQIREAGGAVVQRVPYACEHGRRREGGGGMQAKKRGREVLGAGRQGALPRQVPVPGTKSVQDVDAEASLRMPRAQLLLGDAPTPAKLRTKTTTTAAVCKTDGGARRRVLCAKWPGTQGNCASYTRPGNARM